MGRNGYLEALVMVGKRLPIIPIFINQIKPAIKNSQPSIISKQLPISLRLQN